jgi:hypothetical protein
MLHKLFFINLLNEHSANLLTMHLNEKSYPNEHFSAFISDLYKVEPLKTKTYPL